MEYIYSKKENMSKDSSIKCGKIFKIMLAERSQIKRIDTTRFLLESSTEKNANNVLFSNMVMIK